MIYRPLNLFVFIFLSSLLLAGCASKQPIAQAENSRFAEIEESPIETVEPKITPKQNIAPEETKLENKIFKERIQTVLLDQALIANSLPIINLGSKEQLLLQFDDLSNNLADYGYRIIHCDFNWEPSLLHESEYMDGFTENYISNYSYSLNTLVPYVHYEVLFPNDQLQLKKSGNYIIQVFEQNDMDQVVLQRRFFVLDNRVNVRMQAKTATIVSEREESQEVDFVIRTGDYKIDDPFFGLKVCVRQNRRWDNAITDLKPVFVRNDELDFNLDGPNTFKGGNEYRNADFRSLRFLGDQIARFDTEDSISHVYLRTDPKRSFNYYSQLQDINGERVINIQEGFKPSVEADYVLVHFTLPYSYEIEEDVYVFGALSDWQLSPNFKMSYDEEKQAYKLKVLLKQGYYNYNYAIHSESGEIDETFFEGSHYQTENQYHVFVYNKAMSSRYDELIGFNSVNSTNGF